MALNDIKFKLGQGGLGRALPGEDHISGLVLFTDNLPSGFTTGSRIKEFFSVNDAERAGILADYNDETAAEAEYLVTAVGTNGNTLNITVTEPTQVVNLGTYTKTAAETTVNNVATAIAAVINAGTKTHGYTAVVNTATVTITARAGLGIALNAGAPLTVTIVGTIAGTVTQFSGGVASEQAIWHYHITEYFKQQPKGRLFVGLFAVPAGTYTFSEVNTIQVFALGKIRQVGVYKTSSAFSAADVDTLQAVCQASADAHRELIAIYAGDISGTADLTLLADLSAKEDSLVNVVIGQDGAGLGAQLYRATGKTISCLGAALGATSLAKVNESIAWIEKFNISDGTEFDTPAFGNGVLLTDASISDGLLSTLQDKRYIFLRKFVGIDGTYFNENSSAISADSDYAYQNDNRTIQKATRGIYANLLPALNSPIALNDDGTLADTSVAYFEGLVESPLDKMRTASEISAYDVAIDTQQDVLSSGLFIVTVSVVPFGTARNIQVNIGFNVSIN